ncbi:MAG: MarR family winged helix-turn-helix transcriptional regulator [Pseudomonadota bacterium]
MGIVIGQFPILLELWQKDGVSQRDLLKNLDIEQATLANTLNRMERDGLIIRKRNPSDARVQQIWLTAKARDIQVRAYQAANDQNQAALKALSEAERTQLMIIMRKVISQMRSP